MTKGCKFCEEYREAITEGLRLIKAVEDDPQCDFTLTKTYKVALVEEGWRHGEDWENQAGRHVHRTMDFYYCPVCGVHLRIQRPKGEKMFKEDEA